MVDFIVMTGDWPNSYTCFAERVPVKGEIFEIEGADWTVATVRWKFEAKNSSGYHMMAVVSLFKDAENGQGPIYKKPPLGKLPDFMAYTKQEQGETA